MNARFALTMLSAIALSALLFAAWPDLARPGYTADEEFTEFAVRGIVADGLPLLPSGLLYDRGLLYSYAAAATRVIGEDGLAPARALSLVTAIAALGALWLAVRRVSTVPAAWLAVALVATSMPFWVVATTARFYAPFLALYLGALAMLASSTLSFRRAGLLLVTVALCRWTHELAFTLAVIPVCCLVLDAARERLKWIYTTMAIVGGLVAAQAGIFALHFLAPRGGGTMIRRFFLWQVLNLFDRPPAAAPVGVLLVLLLVALVLRPDLAGRHRSSVNGRLAIGVAAAMVAAVISQGAAGSFHAALDYPLDLFWHLARTMPALTIGTLGLLVARVCGVGGTWTPAERAAHLLWMGWVVFFGVIDSGITINYLLAPVTLMLAAVAIDLVAIARTLSSGVRAGTIATGLIVVLVGGIELGAWGVTPHAHLVAARPTIAAPVALQEAITDAQIVACTDELACLLLTGRVDRWLALDDFLRERFVVARSDGDVGVYAGSPAIYRLADLLASPGRVVIVDVFKDLPVGPSSTFLPRAMAAEGITGRTRLETSQLRVVELNPE